ESSTDPHRTPRIVWVDGSSIVSRPVDSMIFNEEGLRHVIAEVGISHIVYGTDYPYDWPVSIDFILNAPFLSNAEKEALGGTNARRLAIFHLVRRYDHRLDDGLSTPGCSIVECFGLFLDAASESSHAIFP